MEKAIAPSTQSNPQKESELNHITLTDKAVERLGIKTIELRDQFVGNSRSYSGEIVAVPGKTVTVTAPVAGTLLPGRNGGQVNIGQRVSKGQQIFRLLILPTEKDLLSVQEDLNQKQIQYNVGVEKVNRSSQLYLEKAGSLKAKQEAEAELAGIRAQLNVARNRIRLLKGNATQGLADRMSTLSMQAPISGVIQKIYSSTSQVIATAAPIVDIVSMQTLWVRVPIYAGEEGQIDKRANAFIRGLSDQPGSPNGMLARAVSGPQTSDPLSTSIDYYYEIDNSKGSFRPGQKVNITLSLTGTASALVVPYNTILYDIQGGTWVYENTKPNVFLRRRVELQRVSNGMAILKRGPAVGAKIVTDGAAELFGTEFGGGK